MDPTAPRTASRPIIAIDLLRFAAALLVVGYHVDVVYWQSPSPHGSVLLADYAGAGIGNPLTRVGWIGVEMFFVISGGVIATSARHSDWRQFLTRRALRLAPAAWVCATMTLLALLTTGLCRPDILVPWSRSMAFWPVGQQIDPSYWTLGVECFFYLAVAAVMGDGRQPARLMMLASVIGLISGGAWAATWVAPDSVMPVMSNATATLMLLPHGIFFALGMMIALARGPDKIAANRFAKGGRAIRTMAALRILFMVAMVAACMVEIDAHAAGRAATMRGPVSAPLANALFLAMLLTLLAAPYLQAPLARIISPEVARAIGLMTYPLYLLHQDAGAVVIARLLHAGVPFAVAKLLTAALMIALAWWISTRPEPWLRRLLARAFTPRRGPAPDNRPTAFPSGG